MGAHNEQHDLETDRMLGEDECDGHDIDLLPRVHSKGLFYASIAILLAILMLETVLFMIGDIKNLQRGTVDTLAPCTQPAMRREWRSLWKKEKGEFIEAVKCLFQKGSVLQDHGSLYDDFVWVHQWAGQAAHQHQSFLPWHRWFIHQFERDLRDECGYEGSLPYWDWTLDWQDISSSSIWSNEDGFGGENDGSIQMRRETSNNTCVSGPFKNNVFINFNGTIWPHCLSRQLQNSTSERGRLAKELIRPEAIGQLTRSQNYGTLRYMIEMQMHNVIHYGIIGDLTEVSSANDPIFWLHHTQLDRLWYNWQQEDPHSRLMDYSDSSNQTSASGISDEMQYLGLFENQVISRVMRTDTDVLCYKY